MNRCFHSNSTCLNNHHWCNSFDDTMQNKPDVDVLLQGWLLKQGEINKGWKRRYFKLYGTNMLAYMKSDTASSPKGYIDLNEAISVDKSISPNVEPFSIDIITPSRTWVLNAGSAENMQRWLPKLQEHSDVRHKPGCLKEGYLHKRGNLRKSWKHRYFALTSGLLWYFETKLEWEQFKRVANHSGQMFEASLSLAKGVLRLDGAVCTNIGFFKGKHNCFSVETGSRTLYCQTPTGDENKRWVDAITAAIERADKDDGPGFKDSFRPSDLYYIFSDPKASKSSKEPKVEQDQPYLDQDPKIKHREKNGRREERKRRQSDFSGNRRAKQISAEHSKSYHTLPGRKYLKQQAHLAFNERSESLPDLNRPGKRNSMATRFSQPKLAGAKSNDELKEEDGSENENESDFGSGKDFPDGNTSVFRIRGDELSRAAAEEQLGSPKADLVPILELPASDMEEEKQRDSQAGSRSVIVKQSVDWEYQPFEDLIHELDDRDPDLDGDDPSTGVLPEEHPGSKCENCQMDPVIGPLYQCIQCHNFALCKNCNIKKLIKLPEHTKDHEMCRVHCQVIAAASIGDLDLLTRVILSSRDLIRAVEQGSGATPLHHAAENNHKDIAQFLVDCAADVNAKNQRHQTPLHSAAYRGHTEMVQFLLDAGAEINAVTKDDRTPLHDAAVMGRPLVVDIFLKLGSDLNAKNRLGNTPMIEACMSGETNHIRVLRRLLRAKANADVQNKLGFTALTLAIWNELPGIVRTLLHADPVPTLTLRTYRGQTPLSTSVDMLWRGTRLVTCNCAMMTVAHLMADITSQTAWKILKKRNRKFFYMAVIEAASYHERVSELREIVRRSVFQVDREFHQMAVSFGDFAAYDTLQKEKFFEDEIVWSLTCYQQQAPTSYAVQNSEGKLLGFPVDSHTALHLNGTMDRLYMSGTMEHFFGGIAYFGPTFRSLRVLDLSRNNLKTIPSGVTTLYGLKELYLHENELSDLPHAVGYLPLEVFTCYSNRFVNARLVVTLRQRGDHGVLEFLRNERGGITDNIMVNLAIFGAEASGKTSLVKNLQRPTSLLRFFHQESEEISSTKFVKRDCWKFKNLRFNIRDLPGNPNHAPTSRVFLSCENSVFILVINLLEDVGEQFHTWASTLNAMSTIQGRRDVIVVCTHEDDKGADLEWNLEAGRKELYPNLRFCFDDSKDIGKYLFRVNNLNPNDTAFSEIRQLLVKLGSQAIFRGPKMLKEVTQSMERERKTRKVTRMESYIKMLKKIPNSVRGDEDYLIPFLEAVGEVIFFKSHDRDRYSMVDEMKHQRHGTDMVVLDPEWLSKVIQIICGADSEGYILPDISLQAAQDKTIIDGKISAETLKLLIKTADVGWDESFETGQILKNNQIMDVIGILERFHVIFWHPGTAEHPDRQVEYLVPHRFPTGVCGSFLSRVKNMPSKYVLGMRYACRSIDVLPIGFMGILCACLCEAFPVGGVHSSFSQRHFMIQLKSGIWIVITSDDHNYRFTDITLRASTPERVDQKNSVFEVVEQIMEDMWPNFAYQKHSLCSNCVKHWAFEKGGNMCPPYQEDQMGAQIACTYPKIEEEIENTRLSVAQKFYRKISSSDIRGHALVIANGNKNLVQEACHLNASTMQELLIDNGYAVIFKEDLSSLEITDIVKDMAQKDHGEADSFIFFYSGRGTETHLLGNDAVPVAVSKIIHQFKPGSCPSLTGKPKVILWDCCEESELSLENFLGESEESEQTDATEEKTPELPSTSSGSGSGSVEDDPEAQPSPPDAARSVPPRPSRLTSPDVAAAFEPETFEPPQFPDFIFGFAAARSYNKYVADNFSNTLLSVWTFHLRKFMTQHPPEPMNMEEILDYVDKEMKCYVEAYPSRSLKFKYWTFLTKFMVFGSVK